MNIIERFKSGLTYSEYKKLIQDLFEQNKSTGENHSDGYLEYTRLNLRRMNRLEKGPELLSSVKEAMRNIEQPMYWLTLTEGWCGDAAQIIPVQERMTQISGLVTTRYVLRDQHPDLMDLFLTDGGRAIPVIIGIAPRSGEILGSWGPRPKAAQEILYAWKELGDQPYSVFSEQVHSWYAKNKTVDTQLEFAEAVLGWNKKLVQS